MLTEKEILQFIRDEHYNHRRHTNYNSCHCNNHYLTNKNLRGSKRIKNTKPTEV